MKRGIALSLFILFFAANFAEAKVELFHKSSDKKIMTLPCIMSYTDALGRSVRVIRTNPMVIFLR